MKNLTSAPSNSRNRTPKIIAVLCCFTIFVFLNLLPEGHLEDRVDEQVSLEEQQEGRKRMVFDATLYGLLLYGPGTARMLEMESARQIIGLELLMGGGTFWGALKATENYRLGAGRSKLIQWGSYAGTLYGFGIPIFFESENDKAYLASAMLATPMSGLIAHSLSDHRWFEKGETDLITKGGLVGGLYGIAIPYLLDIENLENWTQAKIYTASAMVGVPAGVWATSRLIRDKSISQGRAHLISLGGVVGSIYAAGMTHLAGLGDITIDSGQIETVEHPRAYVFASILGLPLGTYLGYQLTDKDEYTVGRARLIILGAVIGALSGSGVLLLADVGWENTKSYVVANIVGSAAGMWYTHRFTRGWGEELASTDSVQPETDEIFSLELIRISF